MLNKSDAVGVQGVQIAPLGAVVGEKVRVINDYSFDLNVKRQEEGVNRDTTTDEVPGCLCAEASSGAPHRTNKPKSETA